MERVSGELTEVEALLRQQPENFTLSWSFEGTKHFLGQQEAFAGSGEWLVALLSDLTGKPRDDMLAAVKTAHMQFMAAGSSSNPLPSR